MTTRALFRSCALTAVLLATSSPRLGRGDEPIQPEAVPPAPPAAAEQPHPDDQARIDERVQQQMKKQQAAYRERQRALRKRTRLVPHYEYLEDSTLDFFVPRVLPAGDRAVAFEAQAATHLFLVNQWDRVERMTAPGSMASVWSWDVSFVLHLRMVDDRSAPVRPPSYMPSTHVQWFGLWKTAGGGVQELEFELGLTHHSNGQQQCSFVPTDQQGQATPASCVTAGDPNPDRNLRARLESGDFRHNVNYRSGDFSTSFATIGMHYALMTLDSDRFMSSRKSIGVLYQPNFVTDQGAFGWFPGGIPKDQAWMYGIHRLKAEVQGRWHVGAPWTSLAGIASATASGELMWNTAPHIPNNRVIGEVSYTVDGLHGLGVFVRGSTGQDDMNILYAAGRTTMLQFGLIWNTSPAVRYLFGEGEIPGE